jgi:hypothetical protein
MMAQDDKLDALTFEETVIQEEKVPYFGVGGGFITSFFFPGLDDVNTQLRANGLDEIKAPVTMMGAMGVATIGIIPNVRVHISSLGATVSTPEKAFTIGQSTYNRRVNYSVGYTGLGIDYAIQLARSFFVLPGITGAWGTLSLETAQSKAGGNTSDGSVGGALVDPNVFAKRISSNYVMLQPGLAIEFAPPILGNDKPRVLALRLQAGYNLSFMGDWKENGMNIINNQPSSLKASGLSVQAGLMIGLFN